MVDLDLEAHSRVEEEEEEEHFYKVGEEVEVYRNDGWWEGTIHQVLENLRYIVYFRGSGEHLEFKESDIFLNLQPIDSSLCLGASIEVCLDEERSQVIETQAKGPEHTTPSNETKETDMDEASSDIRELDQPLSSMCLSNSNVAQIVDESGMSSDNQPAVMSVNVITRKDSPIGGSELLNSLNVDVSSFCFEGTATNTLLDQAIGDEVSEHTQQSFLICSNSDPMLLEDQSFPFIKCSPVWEIVESWEIFRVMPQRLHFRPLEQFNMVLREGLAIGSMMSFASIVEKVRKSKLDDPLSILQDRSKALEDLKAYGFTVQPIQARLETLLRIKNEEAKLNEELMEAEGQISIILADKISIEAELDEHNKKIRELEECLNQLIKKRELTLLKKEVQDSSIAELKKTLDNVRKHSGTSEFMTLVATPW